MSATHTELRKTFGTELGVVGYADKLSVAPGGEISFFVSCDSKSFAARIVRVTRDPAKFESVTTSIDRNYAGIRQALRPGSYACLHEPVKESLPADLTVTLAIFTSKQSF